MRVERELNMMIQHP